jgi:hypothetical protein
VVVPLIKIFANGSGSLLYSLSISLPLIEAVFCAKDIAVNRNINNNCSRFISFYNCWCKETAIIHDAGYTKIKDL